MIKIDIEDRSVTQLLRRVVERQPDKPFLTCAGSRWSYGQFNAHANSFAHYLGGLGCERGSRVAIMLRNSPEFLISWFGAVKANIVYVPINSDYRGHILKHQLFIAQVSAIVIDAAYLDRLQAVAHELPLLKSIIVVGETQVNNFEGIAVVNYDDFKAASSNEPDVMAHYTDNFAISYTSGTTGPSKGALASHCQVVTFAMDWVSLMEYQPTDRLFTGMPLFHALGAWLGVLPTLLVGAEALIVERFSASKFWTDSAEFGATLGHTIFSIPPILMKQPSSPTDRKHKLRKLYTAQRNKAFEERFNCEIAEIYGQSETGVVTGCWPGTAYRPGSAGKVNTENFDVRIVDDFDNEVPTGEAGEVVIRPKKPYAMMLEYYNMPRETLSAYRNLWFHSGDSGRIDEAGYFFFTDRKKDALRKGGENISSFELERVVFDHPSVLDCAAIAVPSDLADDEVKLVVVLREGATEEPHDLWRFCEQHMPRFWVPRFIEYRKELPRTPTQKIEKYKLRAGVDAGIVYDRQKHTKT